MYTIKPSPPLTPHPLHSLDVSKTTYLCFCSQAWHRGSSALALQPRLGLPIWSSQCHVLHLDIHSLKDSRLLSSTSQSHLAPPTYISRILIPSFCVPCMSYTPCPLSYKLPRKGSPVFLAAPQGSLQNGHVLEVLWPRKVHLGSSGCPRIATP